MKKETFSKRKIGKQLVSVMMLGLAVSPIVLQSSTVLAEDQKKTESVATDSSKQLSDLIEKAKGLGVEIKQSEKKTFQSKAELDAFLKDQIAKLNQAISEAEKSKAENAQIDAANKKAQTDYDAAYKKYQADKAEYDKKLAEYNKSLEDLKKMTGQEGYLSEPIGQSLIFNGEPDATVDISGQDAFINHSKFYDDVKATKDINLSLQLKKWTGDDRKGSIAHDTNNIIVMSKNKPVTVSYTNLKNSSYAGKKISKIVYEYTLLKSTTPEIIAEIYRDPALTIHFSSDDRKNALEIGMKVSFYDDKGAKIEFTKDNPALVSFASLNAENKSNVNIFYNEYVRDLKNLKFIKITGSSVVEKDGVIASVTDNNKDWKDKSSKYYGWDDAKSPVAWYGAGAALITGSDVEFKFGANRDEWQWFAFNAAVKAKSVLQKPVEPKEPEKPRLTNAASKAPSVEISEASMVITKHFDIVTGKELAKEEEGTKPKRQFDGYEFVETKTKDGNTLHFYKPIDKTPIKPKEDKKVYTRHYDKSTGKELAPQEDGTKPKREFDGYKFVETKTKDGDTEHYYEPIKKTYTKFIDKATGKELLPQEDGNNPKKDIPGYRFVETKDEDGNTIHYYEKVITKHIDIDTGEEISEQEDGQKPKKNIDGYEFVETKDDKGNTLHYYRKVKKETPKKSEPKKEEPKKEEPKKSEPVKEKAPTKYADTNESTGIFESVLGAISLMILASLTFIKKRQK